MTLRLTWIAFAVLLAADFATKALIATDPWAWHRGQDVGWKISGFLMVAVALVLMWLPTGWTRVAWVYAAAGLAGNTIDSLDGKVANPFVIPNEGTLQAFNLADLYITGATVIVLPLVAVEVILFFRRHRWVVA